MQYIRIFILLISGSRNIQIYQNYHSLPILFKRHRLVTQISKFSLAAELRLEDHKYLILHKQCTTKCIS